MERLLNTANWGRKGGNDNDSNQREPRRKQIESLFMELPQLRVAPNDDSRYQLTLQLVSNPESALSPSSTTLVSRKTSSPVTSNKSLSHDNHYSTGSSSAIGGAGSSTAILTIYLPPGFPEDEPKITIQPTVRHLWVDGSVTPCVVTGHERLTPGGWSTHANLGKIVKEIAANIQRTGVLVGGEHSDLNNHNNSSTNASNTNTAYEGYSYKPPPPIPGIRSKSLGQFSNQSSSSYSNTNGSHHYQASPGGASSTKDIMSSHHTQTRPSNSNAYSSSLSPEARIVMDLSAEQIEEYLESPIAFQHFFDQLEVVVNSRTLKREWWHGNDNVSRRNLLLEAEMAELQRSTTEGHEVAMQLQKTLEEKLQQQQDALWRFKPETLQSKLRSVAAESDELSDSIAQSFLEGKLDQEGFIRQYRELRKVYHLREMKNERIGSILRNHPSAGSGAAGQDGQGSILKAGTGAGVGSLGSGASMGGGIGVGLGSGAGASSGTGSGPGGAGGTAGAGATSGDQWVIL
ncbi:hypothetical protein EDD21DRAFT_365439 [Dissophora ornata]|nr:hypothetical protein EDD21DRAFT_365439 [Dissophora ornata]